MGWFAPRGFGWGILAMSSFQERIENLRDDLDDLIQLCQCAPKEFFRCDEMWAYLGMMYQDAESALLDEETHFERGVIVRLPRFANDEMRAGMSDLYDEELPQRTPFGWYGCSPNLLPPGDYDKREEIEGHTDDVDSDHLMGFLEPWHDIRHCWFERPMPYKEYKARCATSLYHYNKNVQKAEPPT
jgi:hypothetical protein